MAPGGSQKNGERSVPSSPRFSGFVTKVFGMEKISKSDPVTASEQYLSDLCSRTFLSLWSYPGIHIDKKGRGKEGREVCDLLVVCGRHIIIFSDKHCQFKVGDNIELSWSRWFRKTVQESANQVWGAERLISKYPSRLFLDHLCTTPFPISLPDMAEAAFHRVVVAHGVSESFKKLNGGSGSLMLRSDFIGGKIPFTVGRLGDPSRGFVHVFDDTSLEIVLKTLDTITDFVSYLESKEQLFVGGAKVTAAGEEDLLGSYLEHSRAFILEKSGEMAFSDDRCRKFLLSPQRESQVQADKISYFWDEVIEKFSQHAMNGTFLEAAPADVVELERIFRFMAREPRTRRRLLSKTLVEIVSRTRPGQRSVRVVSPSNEGDPCYVFNVMPKNPDKTDYQNRTERREFLSAACSVVKLAHPSARHIVGIGTELRLDGLPHPEEAVYLDTVGWTEAEYSAAREMQKATGLFDKVTMTPYREIDYPSDMLIPDQKVSRNSSCPCGSGKRYKRCHAQKG
jgi:hypothetical protein